MKAQTCAKRLFYPESFFSLSLAEENVHFAFYCLAAFFVPFMIGQPQLVVGTIVNCFLLLGATFLRGHKIVPVLVLPSLGVLTAGVIWGYYTLFLLIMVPFIWLANAIYVYGYRILLAQTNSALLAVSVASLMKSGFLLGVSCVYVSCEILPDLFLYAMGLIQLISALIGGLCAICIIKSKDVLANRFRK